MPCLGGVSLAADPQDVRIAAAWFTDHGGWLRRRAVKAVGAENADDSLQNLFLKIVGRGRLAEVEEPEKYLTRAQSSVFSSHWRRRSKVELPVEDAALDHADIAPVGERLERIEDAELVRRCLPLLKARHRAVLELHMFGLGREEIAHELSLSPHAVTQLTRRALDSLDYKLKQNGYLRGLVPVTLLSWFREKTRSLVDLMSRHAKAFEGLVPLALVAVASILPPDVPAEVHVPNKSVPAVSARYQEAVPEPRSTNGVDWSGTTDGGALADGRNRNLYYEHEGTQIWVDESHEERQEPSIDEQIRDLANDPGQALPSCPQTVPCPWGDV